MDRAPFRLKKCGTCGQEKLHHYWEPHQSKASGFYGARCWDCYLEASQKYRSTEEGKAANKNGNHAYRTKKKGNTYEFTPKDKALTRQTYREIGAAGLSVDHMQSINAGGPDVWWNLNGLSVSLNSAKGDRSIDSPCWLDDRAAGLPIEAYADRVRMLLKL